ncbi:TOBE domain-containing protein, partial [Candidatus Bathyarchaeota archaeon]|nr:TOBE domain-containing protein [Candidatus Bathyarchaeota archaeon]
PKSIFVMSFVGGANFLEGIVSKVNKFGSEIELRGGLCIRVSDQSRDVGERVVVAIRREHISLGKSRRRGFNNLLGEIEDAMFVGGSMEYVVKLENDMVLFSRILLEGSSKPLRKGEIVIVSFHPRECRVFGYPKRGLLREIEAI